MMDMPFEPKMRPMIVNLVRESSEYKVIVDLSDFDNNENLINVSLDNKVLTISGEVDKKMFGTEKIIKFTQSYYIDEDLDMEKIIREKKGHKYVITIPFED